MKITSKQLDEINFLRRNFLPKGSRLSKREKEIYIAITVMGEKKALEQMGFFNNKGRLFEAKRSLDIMIKMWREDLTVGTLGVNELKEDFNSDYGNKLVDSIIKGITVEYRKKIFEKTNFRPTILSMTNFPDILEKLSTLGTVANNH